MRWLLLTLFVATLVCAQPGLTFPPPKVNPPDEATMAKIKAKTEELRKALEGKDDPTLLLYLKAAEYIVRHNEFYGKQAEWTPGVIDDGLKLAAAGKTLALVPGTTNVRAYRSDIDDSVQPYAVTLPPEYGKDAKKKWPLHVVLHGRDGSLTEVGFIHKNRGRKAAKDLDHVILDVYGRGNNAYRWAGEMDVHQAIGAVWLACRIDGDRVVLRGFSMGGAGTWHLGLHFPGAWCVIGPGAGFTTTRGYVGKLNLTPVQEKTLHIYDAVDYAENAFNVPIVAYSGEDDAQKKAADNIEAALGKLGMKMTHLISPKTGHTIPPAYQKQLAARYAKYVEQGRDTYPKVGRFTTYTLRYSSAGWAAVLGLERHYERARVERELGPDGVRVKTENVRRLMLYWPDSTIKSSTSFSTKVTIDGTTIERVSLDGASAGWSALFEKDPSKGWRRVREAAGLRSRETAVEKSPRLQGPIDDAFMTSFLCVRGTGTPWNPAVAAYAKADLERFQREWSKFLRGDIRVKDDKDVTEDDVKGHALVLFGDPGSNSVLARMLPKLPLTWTKDKVTWNGKEYDAATHVPAFIHPSPINPGRYVVINSGHTFHQDAFEGTNALLYPRLGDHALLRLTDPAKPLAMEVVTAGLFDEFWKFPSEGK